jgi:ATP-binding cassette, subfamily F, member 3
MDEYTDIVLGKAPSVRKAEKVAAAPTAKAPQKLMTPVLKKKIQEQDLKILKIKDKIILLEQALADHTIYQQEPKKAADFARLRSKFEGQLEQEENHWLELHEGTLNA